MKVHQNIVRLSRSEYFSGLFRISSDDNLARIFSVIINAEQGLTFVLFTFLPIQDSDFLSEFSFSI